jgi:hypothetical protein
LVAVSPCPLLLPIAGASPPEKKKTKKPMHRIPARTMVMGFERRNERDMVGERGLGKKANRGCQIRLVYKRSIRSEVRGRW